MLRRPVWFPKLRLLSQQVCPINEDTMSSAHPPKQHRPRYSSSTIGACRNAPRFQHLLCFAISASRVGNSPAAPP